MRHEQQEAGARSGQNPAPGDSGNRIAGRCAQRRAQLLAETVARPPVAGAS